MKNNGDEDDQVYDWMLLHGGKGWQTNGVSLATLVISGIEADMSSLQHRLRMLAEGIRERVRKRSTKTEWTG